MNEHADLLPLAPLPPREIPDLAPPPHELDDECPHELGEEPWDALIPEDDYEPLPEYGDFWPERDAA